MLHLTDASRQDKTSNSIVFVLIMTGDLLNDSFIMNSHGTSKLAFTVNALKMRPCSNLKHLQQKYTWQLKERIIKSIRNFHLVENYIL